MQTLKVRIWALDASPVDVSEYETQVPTGLSDVILKLIARGLLFENDWTMQDTQSEWWVD